MFRFLQNRKTDWLFLKKKWDWASGIGLLDLVRENFESVKSNPELHGFRFTSLFDWSRKLVPLSEPITSKTNTNHDLVTRVFPRFWWSACFYFELSLPLPLFWMAVTVTLVFVRLSIENWSIQGKINIIEPLMPVLLSYGLDLSLKLD